MAAKMAMYYKQYMKISPENLRTANSRDSHVKCWFYWFLSYRYHAAKASLRIWYIQDGVQDGSW